MPTFEFTSPEGKTYTVEGPQGSSQAQAWDILQGQLAAPQTETPPERPPEAPMTVGGTYKAFDRGVAEAAANLVGLPRTLGEAGGQAMNWLSRQTGLPEVYDPNIPSQAPTTEQARQAIQQQYYGGAAPYEPQNTLERYAQAVGQTAPNALLPGGAITRAANVILPATAAQTTAELGGGPLAQAAAGLAGGIGAGKLGQIAEHAATMQASTMPTLAKLEEEKNAIYQVVDNAGATMPIAKADFDQFASQLKSSANAKQVRPANAAGVYEEINKLPQNGGDVADLLNLRAGLRSLGGRDGVQAQKVLPQVEAEIESYLPGTIKQLDTADANYNKLSTASMLDRVIAKQEIRAAKTGNLGDKLRDAAGKIVENENQMRFLSPEEQQMVRDLSQGTHSQKAMKWISDQMGGWITRFLGSGAVLGIAHYSGHDEALAPIVGTFLGKGVVKAAYNRSIAGQARQVQQQVIANSPYARSIGATVPPPLPSIGGAFTPGVLPATERLQEGQ